VGGRGFAFSGRARTVLLERKGREEWKEGKKMPGKDLAGGKKGKKVLLGMKRVLAELTSFSKRKGWQGRKGGGGGNLERDKLWGGVHRIKPFQSLPDL